MDKTLRQIDQELVEAMRERNLKNAEILDELSAEAQRLGMYDAPARGVVDEVLPALPEQYGILRTEHRDGSSVSERGYTAEQMRDYARLALQAAQPAVPSVPEAAKWAKKVRDFSWRLDAHEQDIADELVAFLESFAATPKDPPAQGVDGEG